MNKNHYIYEYEKAIEEGKLLLIDDKNNNYFDGSHRGTGKTTALKLLEKKGHIVLGYNFINNTYDLKQKIDFIKKCNSEMTTLDVLVDEDYNFSKLKGFLYEGVRIKVNGGITRNNILRKENSAFLLNKDVKIVDINDIYKDNETDELNEINQELQLLKDGIVLPEYIKREIHDILSEMINIVDKSF